MPSGGGRLCRRLRMVEGESFRGFVEVVTRGEGHCHECVEGVLVGAG